MPQAANAAENCDQESHVQVIHQGISPVVLFQRDTVRTGMPERSGSVPRDDRDAVTQSTPPELIRNATSNVMAACPRGDRDAATRRTPPKTPPQASVVVVVDVVVVVVGLCLAYFMRP